MLQQVYALKNRQQPMSPVRALMPLGTARPVRTSILAMSLAATITAYRGECTVAECVDAFVTSRQVQMGPEQVERLIQIIQDRMNGPARLKPILLASEACTDAFSLVTGHIVAVAGFIPGHQVLQGGAIHTLTGRTCEHCGINPETMRQSDCSTGCLDRENCR